MNDEFIIALICFGLGAFMAWLLTGAYYGPRLEAVQQMLDAAFRQIAAHKIALASGSKEAKTLCDVILAALMANVEAKTLPELQAAPQSQAGDAGPPGAVPGLREEDAAL